MAVKGYRKLPDILTKEYLMEQYVNLGRTRADIANDFGVLEALIKARIKEFGLGNIKNSDEHRLQQFGPLSPAQKSMLVGSMMGDGNFTFYGTNAVAKFGQGQKQQL